MDHDSLYCNEEEEKWGDDFADSMQAVDLSMTNETVNYSTNKSENEQQQQHLLSLLSKEKETHFSETAGAFSASFVSDSRREAVEWILKVNGYYGFSTMTAILAVNYLDRYIASVNIEKKPSWVIHLASVSCISLAAKLQETYVPLLLHFQVESKYVFEAKAIQKMELLMLSTLKWRMNVVTPLSFLQHIITMLGLKKNGVAHSDFVRRFERLLLIVVVDSRMVRFEASVLATSSMLHVIHEIEPCNAIHDCYHNQLLQISKMKVKECSELISEIVSLSSSSSKKSNSNDVVVPSSPNGVIDAFLATTTSDADADADADVSSSNDSWAVSSSSSPPDQPHLPLKKKIRIQEQQMRLPLNNSSRVFLEVVGSPH